MSYTEQAQKVKDSRDKIRTSVNNKGQNAPANVRLSELPKYIDAIVVKSGSSVTITVTAPDYEGQEITATQGSKSFKATVTEGQAVIEIDSAGVWKVTAPDGNSVDVEAQTDFSAELSGTKVFGIRVTKAESDPKKRITPLEDLVGLTPITVNQSTGAVNYGDMADTFLFKAMNHVVALSIDGKEEIELNPNDYTKRLDNGQAFNIGDINSSYNIFARCNKLYTYQYSDSTYEYYYISNEKINSNYVANGFFKSGGTLENDYCYIGVYGGSYDSQNRLRSISGQRQKGYISYTNFSEAAKKNGTNYYLDTHAAVNLYEIAYLCMVQNDNPKAALGTGRGNTAETSTDSTNKLLGISSGFSNTKGPVGYEPNTKAVKFMHIEDFLVDSFYFCEEGLLSQNSKVYVRMFPPYDVSSNSSYTIVSGTPAESFKTEGYISASVASNGFGRIMSEFNGSISTYQCEFGKIYTSSMLCISQHGYGIWNRTFNATASQALVTITARLTYIP